MVHSELLQQSQFCGSITFALGVLLLLLPFVFSNLLFYLLFAEYLFSSWGGLSLFTGRNLSILCLLQSLAQPCVICGLC
jgi:hypothetical protein